MSILKVDEIVDASGGSNAVLYGPASPAGSMGFRNRIINGAMVIDQRNAGASVTASTTGSYTYTMDRWAYYTTAASKFTVQQNAGSVTPPAGFTNYIGITSSSAYTPASTDIIVFRQPIEPVNIGDVGFGTANAQTVTLSFKVYSSLTGTFSGYLSNYNGSRDYPFTYTISSANTWTSISITIAGDTSGTWYRTNSGSEIGMNVGFNLGCGSNYLGTANAWSGTTYFGASGSTNVVATNGATFYITGVQLEVGSVATEFERRDIGRELIMCQRYYQHHGNLNSVGSPYGYGYQYDGLYSSGAGAGLTVGFPFPVCMRATPTASANYTDNLNVSSYTFSLSPGGVMVNASATSSGRTALLFGSGGYLNLSAEL